MNTILIADDHPITREPLARLLRYEGYNTVTAANGLEALDRLRHDRPDLILLDMMMPKMNGVAFLEAALKPAGTGPAGAAGATAAAGGAGGVPVILLTGVPDSPDVARARELGVAEVLAKGKFSVEDLLRRVRAHVQPGGGVSPPSPPLDASTAAA